MTLADLRDVYNPLAIKKEVKPPLQSWKDSDAVVLLSDYLKVNSDAGIKLFNDNGVPFLSFSPGITNKDKETGRWAIAAIAASLFLDAADDLIELIAGGKLNLPNKTICNSTTSVDDGDFGAGPSR